MVTHDQVHVAGAAPGVELPQTGPDLSGRVAALDRVRAPRPAGGVLVAHPPCHGGHDSEREGRLVTDEVDEVRLIDRQYTGVVVERGDGRQAGL